MRNYVLLRLRIKQKYITIGAFAESISRGKTFVSKVLNNKATLNQDDIEEWSKLLEISDDMIPVYFFAH